MRIIESNEPELIAEYSRLYRLMESHNIDGFIGTAYGTCKEPQTTLRVFVTINDKFHMVRFEEDVPIIGKHPWPMVDVYTMNNLISADVTGGKRTPYMMSRILLSKKLLSDDLPTEFDFSDMPDINKAINVLKMHNKWRRGDDTIEATDPTELGIALDTVIAFIEEIIK